MTDPTPDVPTLRRLLAEATPGPWEVAAELDGLLPEWAIWMPDAGCDRAMVDNEDDAALIAAVVNALPGVLDRLEAAEGGVARVDIESVLSAHEIDKWVEVHPGRYRHACACGVLLDSQSWEATRESHRAHLATALRAALAEVTP